jgi:hypothetical protein
VDQDSNNYFSEGLNHFTVTNQNIKSISSIQQRANKSKKGSPTHVHLNFSHLNQGNRDGQSSSGSQMKAAFGNLVKSAHKYKISNGPILDTNN